MIKCLMTLFTALRLYTLRCQPVQWVGDIGKVTNVLTVVPRHF